MEGKKRLALEKESVWGIYRGNLYEKLQRYREKQRMFFAFFFAENVCRMGEEKHINVCIFVVFSASSYI